MKKTLLFIIGISIVLNANASNNIFEKSNSRKMEKQKMEKKNPFFKETSTNKNVPTLTKQSYWDVSTMDWNTAQAVSSVYLNDRLMSELTLSYNLMDTTSKTTYTYDNNGKLSNAVYSWYDYFTATFIPTLRATYTYSNNGLKMTIISENKDSIGNWENELKYIIEINDRGANILNVNEQFNSQTNNWELIFKNTSHFTYFQNTKTIISQIDSNFDANLKTMLPTYKTIRTLNSAGQVLTVSDYSYNMGVENFEEYDSLFYNSAGTPVELIGYDPSSFPNITPRMKISNLVWAGGYNSTLDIFENEPLSYMMYQPGMNGWEIAARQTTTFPDNNGSIVRLSEDYINNAYVPSYRRSTFYDIHKSLIKESEENYDSQLNTWNVQYGYKDSLQYDANGNTIEDIFLYYDINSMTYSKSQRLEYSNFLSITQGFNTSKNTLEISLFPNPSADGKVNININLTHTSLLNIEVSDLSGRVISSEKMMRAQGLNTITLSNLSQGLYFISVKTDTGINKSKLVVN